MFNSKFILFYLTIIIDLVLFNILNDNINNIDKYFIYLTFLCHILFYYSLITENKILLDILHLFVFILPFLSIFLINNKIKIVVTGLLICIQILWIVKGKCILHDLPTNLSNFGYGKSLRVYVLSLILILFNQILN